MLKPKPILPRVVVVIAHQIAAILRGEPNSDFISKLRGGPVIPLRHKERRLELNSRGFVEVEAHAKGGSLFGEGGVEVEVVVMVNDVACSQEE